MTVKVAVVDYGLGNVQSVAQALRAAAPDGTEVLRSGDPDVLRRADRLVMPGQGGFRECAIKLKEDGLGEAILERIRAGTPYLGICLGLQILFEASDEAPGFDGFGWFAGSVKRLEAAPGLKIPHMGWNSLELHAGGHELLQAAGGQGAWVYFVHSFHAVASDPALVKATASYGPNAVTAAIARDNVVATQFHPEKSQSAGIRLLERFLSDKARALG